MRLDIRLPLGLLFSVFGLLLLAVGLGSSKELYERSLGININFWWGAVMLLFGLASFVLGHRSQRRSTENENKTSTSAAHR
jgi:hypothetical protein